MSIKFQYGGNPVEVDTAEEFFAIVNANGKTANPVASKPNRTKPSRVVIGQDRYRSFISDLADDPKKVVMAIGSHSEISMNELAKAVGAESNQQLSAWITIAGNNTAKKHGIEPQQLWEKKGPRGNVKFTPTHALRSAVEALRDNKISAVKQTA
jgi:hypothetical protein